MAQEAGRAHVYPSEQVACDEINELKAPLIAIGVPAVIFNEDVYLAAGYFPRSVASYLKLFSAYPEQGKLEQVLYIGIIDGMFNTIRSLNARTFFQFCAFLRSPEGQSALAKVARYNERLKRVCDLMELTDVELVELFEVQGIGYANSVIKARRELKPMIMDFELQYEQTIESVKKEYAPFATDKNINDLNTKFWNVFIHTFGDPFWKRHPLGSPVMIMLVKAVELFVRTKHMLYFINEDLDKRKLEEYWRRTITNSTQETITRILFRRLDPFPFLSNICNL